VNNRIVNRGVDIARVERVTGRTVQRYNITESNSARTSEIRGNQVGDPPPDRPRANPTQRP